MDRRNLLKTALLTSLLPNFNMQLFSQQKFNFIKPNKLKEGDKVKIIAPSTNVSCPDEIQNAIQVLDYLKLKYEFGKSFESNIGYKTNSTQVRVDDIHQAFEDDTIKGIFCIRGGYGSGQILNSLDYNLIRKHPKIFIGYSDITALHLAINKFSGLVTFHGPVLLSSFSTFTITNFVKTIFNSEPVGILKNPNILSGVRATYPIRTINGGIAEGYLIGGNLSIISSLMGTKFEIDTTDKILFLEDVGEEPYKIDRMLNQLKLAGKLDTSKGIIFGKCAGCDINSSAIWDLSLGEVLNFYFKDLQIPVFYGLLIGHTSDQLTLPLGIKAKIDADNCQLEILESAVI